MNIPQLPRKSNDTPKVTQLLDIRPRMKIPFFAPSTSFLFSLPFHIQHDNDT